MLVGINHLIGAPVMSLQTGQPLARLDSPIINPRNLRIVAFYVSGPKVDFKPAVVFTDDIREFGEIGAIVDSSDNVLSPEGMVRLLEVINYNFLLTGLPVSDDHHQKIGKTTFDRIERFLNLAHKAWIMAAANKMSQNFRIR